MIQEQLAFLPEFLSDYRPFPPAKERTAWQGLPLRAKQRFLQAGEAALQTPIAPLPLSLWLDFTHTGRRTPWETAYFSRRARLCALVSAECVEHKGRFLDAIADTVWAICEESAWQLPAHNSYIRDTPQLPLPDTTRPIVDLFAAETGALLALARYLLPDELDTAAPGITARMEQELDARILTPYFTSHFWWMGNGEEPMCNWTSWCTQNVLLTVFLLPTTQQQRNAAVKQAAYSLDCFLKDYGADGCCNEGAQYYRHAGLTLWGCLEILSSIVPEAFSPLFHEPKIKNIAEYICNVHVEGPYYLNFGDCSPLAGRCGAREYRFWAGCGQRCFASPCGGRLPRRCRPRPFAEPGRQHPHQPVVPADHRLCRRRNDDLLRSAPAPFNGVVSQRGHLCRAAGQLGAGCKVRLQRRQPQSQRYRQHYCIQGRQNVPDRYRSGELHQKDLQPPAV